MIMIPVPSIPDNERIESMCFRFDHSHGIKTFEFINGKYKIETDKEWKIRQEYNRTTMLQLYEEATGQGFYKQKKETTMILDSKNFIRECVWLNAWMSVAGCTSCHIASNASRWANICLSDFDAKFPEYRLNDEKKNSKQ